MVHTYTLTPALPLDSTIITPQIYPKGKFRCVLSALEPDGGGIGVARAVAHLDGTTTAVFPVGGTAREHLVALFADENAPASTIGAKDWTRQNLHVHAEPSSEQYCFVMSGTALADDEFHQLQGQVLEVKSGALLVINGSLPLSAQFGELTRLIATTQKQGIRRIVDSSGKVLTAALVIGNIELAKPNFKELSALVSRELTQSDDVRKAAQEIVQSEKAHRTVVSLGPQRALGVDHDTCVQVVPPPVKGQSTVGAGGSVVGAVTLKLAKNASFGDVVRYGVATSSAVALDQGIRLCSLDDT